MSDMKFMELLNRLNEVGRHADLVKAETELLKCLSVMSQETSVGAHDRAARGRDLLVHRARLFDCAKQLDGLVQDLEALWPNDEQAKT